MKCTFKLLGMILVFAGCAAGQGILGITSLNPPPEFNQKVLLEVSDKYTAHQAALSQYDPGDLENFHIQHTFPVVIEDAFREVFGEVEILKSESPQFEMTAPEVPAIFEVKMVDVANDNSFDAAVDYRGEVTLVVAMKSPKERRIFWQKSFLGKGYVRASNEFSTGLGPQDALADALRDAVTQMQEALIDSPQVRAQLKYYKNVEASRPKNEVKI